MDEGKTLNRCKVSEPMPSKPYALPKDHKSGNLKGRPIISKCDSVVRQMSKLLADTLNPLVEDFEEILNLMLLEDRYLLEGRERSQIQGIAMGNCAAPPLAIIYMNHIENKIQERCPDIIIWRRYIDDIFFMDKIEAERLLEIANTVHTGIQFTLEKAVENKLPFLDTMVHVNDGKIEFSLYVNPTHSGASLTFDSFVPHSRKRALVWSELLRVKRRSAEKHIKTSQMTIKKRLLNNGFPRNLIKKTEQLLTENSD